MGTKKVTEHELYSGKRLKRFRRKKNWTRYDLEFELAGEVTERTLGNWERRGIPANVQIKKLEAVAKALGLPRGLEDLEKVETDYLNELTLDIVQERLETGSDDMKANEIVKIVEFVDKRKESEGGEESESGSEEAPYNPLADLVEDKPPEED